MTSPAPDSRSGFQDYPYLTREEFSEVCHHLDRRYRQTTLGPIRRQWKLNVCTALDTSFAIDAEYTTHLQVTRPLEGELDHGDLSSELDHLSFGGENDPGLELEDHDMTEAEDADEVGFCHAREP